MAFVVKLGKKHHCFKKENSQNFEVTFPIQPRRERVFNLLEWSDGRSLSTAQMQTSGFCLSLCSVRQVKLWRNNFEVLHQIIQIFSVYSQEWDVSKVRLGRWSSAQIERKKSFCLGTEFCQKFEVHALSSHLQHLCAYVYSLKVNSSKLHLIAIRF